MSADINKIHELVGKIVEHEQKVETAIASEKDVRRRERLLKACQERNVDAIREILFTVD